MFAKKSTLLIAALGLSSLLSTGQAAALDCSVTADVWGDGYVATVNVINDSSSSISSWQVSLNFNQAPNVGNGWNAELSTSGNTVSASNVFYNGNLAPGNRTSFGFQGGHNGNFQLPTCDGGSGTNPPPTSTPTATPTPQPTGEPTSQPTATPTPTDEPTTGLYPNYNTNPIPADMSGMGSNAQQLANRIRLGWNVGNTMEALGGETAWGNPEISEQLIQLVKSSGFDSIRLPVAWNDSANQSNAKLNDAWLDRVKDVIQICVDNDLTVLVNVHWDGGWLEENVNESSKDAVNAKQKAFWQQIATHLRDFDERVMFASANEPRADDAAEMNVLLSYHQTFIDAVRSTGGKNAYRVLVVQGPNTDIEITNELMNSMPTDSAQNRLMAEVHFYTPYQFTLMAADEWWGNQFFYWGEGNHSSTDTDHNPTWGEEDWVDQMFSLMQTQFVSRGIPVVLGEYGTARRTDQLTGQDLELHLQSRAYWHQYVTQSALTHGLIPYYWDNGGTDARAFGIFDRDANSIFDDQTMDALKEGAGVD